MIERRGSLKRGQRTSVAVSAALVVGLVAGATGALAQDTTLRVAMGSPGAAGIAVWDDIAAQFEAANPGVDVEMNYQDDDLYQTIGLPNLLAGRNAPDVYCEWTGNPMKQRFADGYGADLSDAVTSGPLAGLLSEGSFVAASVDDQVVLMPHTADVTNVLFYNVPLLAENGVTPPTTWEELLAACDTLSAAGVIPISTGNKELWAAGNWLSHIASRVVGEEAYDATLNNGGPFSTPEWEQALGYIEELVAHDCVNASANAVDDNAGAELFFQGQAAMHPIGSWLVSWAVEAAPDLEFDFVNLPAMPEGSAGDQTSVIGVETGHMVNANSENIDLAVEFLALVNSPENVTRFIGSCCHRTQAMTSRQPMSCMRHRPSSWVVRCPRPKHSPHWTRSSLARRSGPGAPLERPVCPPAIPSWTNETAASPHALALPGAGALGVRGGCAAADGADLRLQLHRVERLRAHDVRGLRQLHACHRRCRLPVVLPARAHLHRGDPGARDGRGPWPGRPWCSRWPWALAWPGSSAPGAVAPGSGWPSSHR